MLIYIYKYIHFTLKVGLTRLIEFFFTYSATINAIYISIYMVITEISDLSIFHLVVI